MPKFKDSKTKTGKKVLNKRQALVQDIQKDAGKFSSVYSFTSKNMRNGMLKKLREEWRPSRFYYGKLKALVYALGKHPKHELRKNMHLVARYLKGQCGLFFTDTPKHEVVEWFKNYRELAPARSGDVATETVILEKGPCSRFTPYQVEMLKRLPLPITLIGDEDVLVNEYTVCKRGDVLTSEQCRILDILNVPMSEFTVELGCVWTSDGKFQILSRE